jgi:hypothetical protein
MRTGRSGIYACAGGMLGYRLYMLDKQAMSSYYRDPFLSAIRHESGVPESAVEGTVGQNWSNGPCPSRFRDIKEPAVLMETAGFLLPDTVQRGAITGRTRTDRQTSSQLAPQ